MKKKIIFIIVLILAVIIVLGFITNYVDSGRVGTGHEPKYCIRLVSEDGSKVTYWGFGYKVIRYVATSPNEPFKNNIGVKMGSWFMNYELPKDDIDINNLDDFYSTKLTIDNDIRNLSKEYNLFDAEKDGWLVVGAMVHNDSLYDKFMNDYKNKTTSFIRVAQSTDEGDTILYDILYYAKTNKVYLVTDNTRDEYSTQKDRSIELNEFENISEYEYKDHLYWVLYNGTINDEEFESDNVFVITTIN